jgi:hypothetical protein
MPVVGSLRVIDISVDRFVRAAARIRATGIWITRSLSGLRRVVCFRAGHSPAMEDRVMKRVMKETLRLVTAVSLNPRVKPDQRDQLLKAKRSLTAVAKSGKLDRRKVYLAANQLAAVLQNIVES